MNIHPCNTPAASPAIEAPSLEAAMLSHTLTNIAGSLSDIAGTISFCERQIFSLSDDRSMGDETEKGLMGFARVLGLVGRLLDSEIDEVEKLVFLADSALKAGRRRATV